MRRISSITSILLESWHLPRPREMCCQERCTILYDERCTASSYWPGTEHYKALTNNNVYGGSVEVLGLVLVAQAG